MIRKKFLTIGLIFVLSATAVVVSTESNSVDINIKDKQISTQVKTSIGTGQQEDPNKFIKKIEDYIIENQVLKYAIKSYQESIETLKWAIGAIISLIGIIAAAVGFVVVRHRREYKEILDETKEASKDANRYAEKAEEKLSDIDKKVVDKIKEIERKGVDIDKKVEEKLKEIENKGNAKIEALIEEAKKRREESRKEAERQLEEARKEAERQRKISELWNEGLRAAKNEDYESAAERFRQIVEDFKYEEAYYNWGTVLVKLARRKEGDERQTLLEKAKEKLLKAESIKQGSGAYNLACINCLMGDEGQCRKWLEVGQEEGTLATREEAMKDEDLENVSNKEWFKAIRWKGE